MTPITSPDSISDPHLRQIGDRAIRIVKLETAIAYFDDQVRQRSHPSAPAADPVVDPTMTRFDVLAFAKDALSERLADERRRLADELLDDRPDRWDLLWTEVIAPWRMPSEGWRAGTPPWIRAIGSEAVLDRHPSPEIQATRRPLAPTDLGHPLLRAFAQRAAWVTKLRAASESTTDDVADDAATERCTGVGWFYYPDDEDLGMPEDDLGCPDDDLPWEDDPLEQELLVKLRDAASQQLENGLTAWLRADPEHLSIFHLLVVRPWEQSPGRLRPDRPDWVAVLTEEARSAVRTRGDHWSG